MNKLRRFYSASGEGGATGSEGDADGSEGKTKDGNADADKSKDLTPDQRIAALETELATKKTDYEKVTKKLGEQSGQVGALKDFQAGLKDPKTAQGMITKMATDAGLNISFGESAEKELLKLMESDEPKDKLKAMKLVAAGETEGADPALVAKIDSLTEGALALQYKDWEDRSTVRAAIALSELNGKTTKDETLHMAARGMAIPDIIKEAEARGAENYRLELEKKNQEQIDSGGGRKQPAGDADSAAKYLRTALEAGRNLRPQ